MFINYVITADDQINVIENSPVKSHIFHGQITEQLILNIRGAYIQQVSQNAINIVNVWPVSHSFL